MLILSCVLLDYAGGFIYSKYKNRRSRKQKQTRKHASIMEMAISFFNSRVGNTIKNIVSKVSVLVVKIKLLVCPAIFERKCILDHLFFNYKSKSSRWNKSKYLFMCYFTCQAQTITDFLCFNLIYNFGRNPRWWPRWRTCLVTLQASSSANTHEIYLILWRRWKAFHWRHFFGKYCSISKTQERGFINFPLSVQRWGHDCVYVRG